MMNCGSRDHAEAIIKAIAEDLDEEHLRTTIDGPVDKVLNEFRHEANQPVSCKEFHEVISKFMRKICEEVTGFVMTSGPLSEAISLIEKHYEDGPVRGYPAARLDADKPDWGGMDIVLQRVAQSLKSAEREKYIQAVYARHLGVCNWVLRCEIARILIERCYPFFPQQMQRCVPEQMADEIPSLMKLYLGSLKALSGLSS